MRRLCRVSGLAGAVVATLVLSAGCGGGDNSSAPPRTAAPTTTGLRDVPPPAVTTPEGVAVAALREIFSWRPVAEKPGESLRRARQWLGPALLRVVDGTVAVATTSAALPVTISPTQSPPSTTAGLPTDTADAPPPAVATAGPVMATPVPDLRWSEWATAGARVDAFAFASGEVPVDTSPARVQRKIGIEQTVSYPGRSETLPSTSVIATLVKTADGWRLDDFQ